MYTPSPHLRAGDGATATGDARAAPPLALAQLVVAYGTTAAVRGVSLTVRPGEIYGLLGSNGAGKSSTIRAVVGLVPPAAGSVRVFGHDPAQEPVAVKRAIGYVPETPLLFDALTPREFLEYVASVRGMPAEVATERLARYRDALRLDGEIHRPLATLSAGTRQKVLLVAALLPRPPLLVLDEPFTNLDPRTVRVLKELLVQWVRRERRGILFSTHTLEVAERLCDRVGILDGGRLVGEGSLATLRRDGAAGDGTLESIFLRLTAEEEGVRAAVRALDGVDV